jgi:hypothetical protein
MPTGTTLAHMALLEDRGTVAVTGPDALPFLDNLVSNDLSRLEEGDARFAALLSPQGKLLFEFFAARSGDGVLLDTARAGAAELTRRLGLYKLRAKVTITDRSPATAVAAAWWTPAGAPVTSFTYAGRTLARFADPREPRLGVRIVLSPEPGHPAVGELAGITLKDRSGYDALRIALAVPEGGRDYPLGDTFPHEANMDRLAGLSFDKGCYVGQEVVARMQNKTVVRKRIVRVSAPAPLASGDEIRIGEAVIGAVGTVAGGEALALLRLDRAAEAADKAQPLTTSRGVSLTVDDAALAAYRESVASRPVIDL